MSSSIPALFIKGTSKNPEIDFKPGVLLISGRSIPEDSISFYEPVIKWVETYIKNPEALTRINLKIEYINSGSNRFVFSILKMMDEMFNKGKNVVVNWYYEEDDDTLYNLGRDFQGLVSLPFKLIPIE